MELWIDSILIALLLSALVMSGLIGLLVLLIGKPKNGGGASALFAIGLLGLIAATLITALTFISMLRYALAEQLAIPWAPLPFKIAGLLILGGVFIYYTYPLWCLVGRLLSDLCIGLLQFAWKRLSSL